ncbi:MAG: hypothetical protein MJZ65_00190 [Paludibacteraceae bacterium]|nr:hypothetical protein [Paludibacteraceae bacterium]
MRKFFMALMAVAAIALAIAGCEKENHATDFNPEPPENLIPPTDTDGANQNKWGLAPERIPLTVTSTENNEE